MQGEAFKFKGTKKELMAFLKAITVEQWEAMKDRALTGASNS